MTMNDPLSKRRPGELRGGPPVADPRPRLDGDVVLGVRCAACGYPAAPATPWCPVCNGAELTPARFGPVGRVWASTVVQGAVLKPGTRVRIVGASETGDIVAKEDSHA